MTTIRNEIAHTISGVPGRLMALHVPPTPWAAGVFANQTWVSESRDVSGYGTNVRMTVHIRFDDNCKNGHMSFAITAEVRTLESRRMRDIAAGGCMHDEIAQTFPELAPLIKWHLCATDGPMHYVANTVYLAGNRDHNGLRAGEKRQIRNGRTGQLAWKLAVFVDGVEVNQRETLPTYVDSDEQPTATGVLKYVPWCTEGEGKARDLDAARRVAIWPEATDEQLSAAPDELRAMLGARLPALLAEFRADMERIGFLWEAPARGE